MSHPVYNPAVSSVFLPPQAKAPPANVSTTGYYAGSTGFGGGYKINHAASSLTRPKPPPPGSEGATTGEDAVLAPPARLKTAPSAKRATGDGDVSSSASEGEVVRECGTPGCTLPDHHEGPCGTNASRFGPPKAIRRHAPRQPSEFDGVDMSKAAQKKKKQELVVELDDDDDDDDDGIEEESDEERRHATHVDNWHRVAAERKAAKVGPSSANGPTAPSADRAAAAAPAVARPAGAAAAAAAPAAATGAFTTDSKAPSAPLHGFVSGEAMKPAMSLVDLAEEANRKAEAALHSPGKGAETDDEDDEAPWPPPSPPLQPTPAAGAKKPAESTRPRVAVKKPKAAPVPVSAALPAFEFNMARLMSANGQLAIVKVVAENADAVGAGKVAPDQLVAMQARARTLGEREGLELYKLCTSSRRDARNSALKTGTAITEYVTGAKRTLDMARVGNSGGATIGITSQTLDTAIKECDDAQKFFAAQLKKLRKVKKDSGAALETHSNAIAKANSILSVVATQQNVPDPE